MTREEAERALDECHRELQALLKRYGAELEQEDDGEHVFLVKRFGRGEWVETWVT